VHDVLATPGAVPTRITLRKIEDARARCVVQPCAQREAKNVACLQPKPSQERQGMPAIPAIVLGTVPLDRPSRRSRTGSLPVPPRAIGDRWIPIVKRPGEVLQTEERKF